MSKKPKTVNHLGTVQEVSSTQVMVSILSHSACSGCHVKVACGMADSLEKTVRVHKPNHGLEVGQDVRVILRQSLGFKALFMGYIVPFLVVLLALILLTALGVPEARAGLVSLAMLIPYYGALYLFRDSISEQFTFEVESIK